MDFESKLHLALTYQPEPRMLPFGTLVWYLGKSKDPNAPKTFGPNGKPAIYVGPEVSSGMRCKDVHVMLDLELLTSSDRVREIITRDFIPPVGPWIFPLTGIPMLRSLQPEIPLPLPVSDAAQSASGDVGRNRSITRRRLQHYGPTPGCASCLNGTYQHTHTHTGMLGSVQHAP